MVEEVNEINALIRGTEIGQIKWTKEISTDDPEIKHYVADTNGSPWVLKLTLSGISKTPTLILNKVQALFGAYREKDIVYTGEDGNLLKDLADIIEESLSDEQAT